MDVAQVREDAFPDHFEAPLRSGAFDYILIDFPGVYAKALTFAAGSADIVVIPVMPSEPNLHGAVQTIREVRHLERAYQTQIPSFAIPHFVLKTNISPLNNNKAALWLHGEIERIHMPNLSASLMARPVYQDVFSTGLPAHQVDPGSPAAVDEAADVAVSDPVDVRVQGIGVLDIADRHAVGPVADDERALASGVVGLRSPAQQACDLATKKATGLLRPLRLAVLQLRGVGVVALAQRPDKGQRGFKRRLFRRQLAKELDQPHRRLKAQRRLAAGPAEHAEAEPVSLNIDNAVVDHPVEKCIGAKPSRRAAPAFSIGPEARTVWRRALRHGAYDAKAAGLTVAVIAFPAGAIAPPSRCATMLHED